MPSLCCRISRKLEVNIGELGEVRALYGKWKKGKRWAEMRRESKWRGMFKPLHFRPICSGLHTSQIGLSLRTIPPDCNSESSAAENALIRFITRVSWINQSTHIYVIWICIGKPLVRCIKCNSFIRALQCNSSPHGTWCSLSANTKWKVVQQQNKQKSKV